MNTINESGKVTTFKRLHIRSTPNRVNPPVSIVEINIQLAYDGYTEEGEAIDGNAKWYFTHEGNWFWSGGAQSAATNYNELFKNIPDQLRAAKGSNVMVAVMDTGIYSAHPDFTDAFDTTRFPFRNYSNSDSADDLEGHGTHVAGLIGARGTGALSVTGVAPACTLQSIKVLRDNGLAVGTAVESGLKSITAGTDIINMSLSVTVDEYNHMISFIDEAAKTSVIIAAAGSNGLLLARKDRLLSPALSPNVISVGVINSDFVKTNPNPKFHPRLDYILPEMSLRSASLQKDNLYLERTGSSMATALVSGLAALIVSACKTAATEPADLAFVKKQLDAIAIPYNTGLDLNSLTLIKP